MTLRDRVRKLERKHPAGAVIVLDEADREPGEGRAWHDGHLPTITYGYAQRGESAKAWATRVGFDPGRRPLVRLAYLRG